MPGVRVMVLAAVAVLSPLATAALQGSFGIDEVRALIAAHEPRVYEDTAINTVVIVVDAKGKYVSSFASRLDAADVAATDFRFAQLEELLAAREGRRQVDTLLSYSCSSHSQVPASQRPVCVLDGVRVGSFDPLQVLAIRSFEMVKGSDAAARYGAEAVNGALIATTAPTLVERFRQLGVTAANMDWLQSMRVRPGTVGPRRLDILLLYLKA